MDVWMYECMNVLPSKGTSQIGLALVIGHNGHVSYIINHTYTYVYCATPIHHTDTLYSNGVFYRIIKHRIIEKDRQVYSTGFDKLCAGLPLFQESNLAKLVVIHLT